MTKDYSPLKTIRLQDFQVFEDATLELGRLTVLVGGGDRGKSTILRALRAVALNDGYDEDIRHGQKTCTVTLTFDDGTEIEWWKEKKKGGCYRMTDSDPERVFVKTGSVVPDEIAAYLGIGQIEVDSATTLTPQLSDQFDPVFLLSETGSRRARILGKATRLDTVVSAQMTCTKELKQTNRELEQTTTELAGVRGQLEVLPDYKSLEARLDEVDDIIDTIISSIETINRLEGLAHRIEEMEKSATAVDVEPLYNRLTVAAEALERAEELRILGERLPTLEKELADMAKRLADHQEALASFTEQHDDLCAELGLCTVCNGLKSHKECVA